jgi:hypothetical protein
MKKKTREKAGGVKPPLQVKFVFGRQDAGSEERVLVRHGELGMTI